MAVAVVLDRRSSHHAKFEAEEAFGWPVIGEIPRWRSERLSMSILAYDEPRSRAAEAYRVLRSALLFVQPDRAVIADGADHPIFANTSASSPEPPAPGADPAAAEAPRGQVIMVTSPGPAEGKTTTAANLAAILAETGRSVLVINCDFRRPRVHLYLGAEDAGRQVVDTKVPGVKLVTQVLEDPDDANPAEVVKIQRQVIRNAREHFDIVLLDTAPLLTTNDATEVLVVADQVVIVAKTGKTHREAADRAAELLERRGGPVVGVVLVGATDVPTSRYYYYGDAPDLVEPEPGGETETPLAALLDEDAAATEAGARVPAGPDGPTDAEPGAPTRPSRPVSILTRSMTRVGTTASRRARPLAARDHHGARRVR
jgi:Mrp family chromosome partitioning ATPase